MCDYCDCRAQPVIAALSAGHGRLAAGELTDAVFGRCAEHDEISAAVDAALLPGSVEPAASRRAQALFAEHIRREETDVFPAAALALSANSLGAAR